MTMKYVWGEGFASDDLFQISAVTRWEDLADGEAFRFFPRLRAGEDLSTAIAARICERADQIERSLLADSGSAGSWLEPDAEDAAWLRGLASAPEVRRMTRDLTRMARFAFLTGLHPAYLWAEAESLRHWGATAAWLGEFSRRQRALMPLEVADYLNDALINRAGGEQVRDVSLSPLIRCEALAGYLRRSALQRLEGVNVEARWERFKAGRAKSIYENARLRLANWASRWSRQSLSRGAA